MAIYHSSKQCIGISSLQLLITLDCVGLVFDGGGMLRDAGRIRRNALDLDCPRVRRVPVNEDQSLFLAVNDGNDGSVVPQSPQRAFQW